MESLSDGKSEMGKFLKCFNLKTNVASTHCFRGMFKIYEGLDLLYNLFFKTDICDLKLCFL
jgi:hypothetical protein